MVPAYPPFATRANWSGGPGGDGSSFILGGYSRRLLGGVAYREVRRVACRPGPAADGYGGNGFVASCARREHRPGASTKIQPRLYRQAPSSALG